MSDYVHDHISKYVLANGRIGIIRKDIIRLENDLDDTITDLEDAALELASAASRQPILYTSPSGKKRVVVIMEWWVGDRKILAKIMDVKELEDE